MSRLNVVIVAMCGGALGFLSGLLIAGLMQGDLGEVEDERDRLKAEVARVSSECGRLAEGKRGLTENARMFQQELAAGNANRQEAFQHLLQAEAFIGLLNRFPETRSLLLGEAFQEQYKADWYWPETAVDLVGGKWLLDDMVAQGLLDEDLLSQAAEPATPWRMVNRWLIRGTKSTETFLTKSPTWRIRWKVTADPDTGMGSVAIGIRRPIGDFVNQVMGEGEDSSFVRAAPGRFYLDVSVIGEVAEIVVEEPDLLP